MVSMRLHALFQGLCLIVCASLSTAWANDLVPFPFQDQPAPPPKQPAPQRAACSFPNLTLPNDFVVYGAGGYSGKAQDFQIDQSGYSASQFDVAVNETRKPVVLILGAYEPSVWNIGWSPGTKILAVLASGYHKQVIAGLSAETPQLVSTYDNKDPCGYFYITEGQNRINPISRQLFGRPVEMVFPQKNGKVVVGEPLRPDTRLVTSEAKPPRSYSNASAPMAGPQGLEAAVRMGLLRKATSADADQWVEALVSANPNPDVPPIAGIGIPKPPKPSVHNAYVVLKPYTFPEGLYGGMSATFYLPKGVPMPNGNPGHSAVYDFNTLRCGGALCGH